MKKIALIFVFLLFFSAFSLTFGSYVDWQELKSNYFNEITKFQPSLLVTNPFYSLKFKLYSLLPNNKDKIWNYLDEILAQAIFYREQNKELVEYLLNQYFKNLKLAKPVDVQKLVDHFFILSFLEKELNRQGLADELLILVKENDLVQLESILKKKSEFESFYFLFKLSLIADENVKNKIENLLAEKEFAVIDFIILLSDKDWQEFKENSPYDKITILYLEFMRNLAK